MWNLENKLALAGQDKVVRRRSHWRPACSCSRCRLASGCPQMTISNEKGETGEQAHLKYDPFDIQFAEQKVDEKQTQKENTVSINMGHQTILMYNMVDTDNPVELAFQ